MFMDMNISFCMFMLHCYVYLHSVELWVIFILKYQCTELCVLFAFYTQFFDILGPCRVIKYKALTSEFTGPF